MNTHYRPPRSGKRSLAVALIAPVVLAAGIYTALDHPSVVVPSAVTPPDTAQRSTKTNNEPSYIIPSPMPQASADVQSKAVPARALGPGVFKCEEASGAITYSQYPCGDAKLIDIRPTSGGFAENWSITVKGR